MREGRQEVAAHELDADKEQTRYEGYFDGARRLRHAIYQQPNRFVVVKGKCSVM